jgi:type IV pilus assembly protein PilV
MLMIRRSSLPSVRSQEGTTMMEVLVSIIIAVAGLIGLAGLQSRISLSEAESFQRAQAVVLLQDMVDRISANRKRAANYVTTTAMGTGQAAADCSTKTDAARDLCEWSNSLLGASEASGGLKVGAMLGARGCVVNTVATMPTQYLVSVVWQGVNQTVAPAATACGQNLYGDEKTRRAVTATVMVGCLQNDPASLACITTP